MSNFIDQIKCIGAAIGHGGEILGSEQAPDVIYNTLSELQEKWQETIRFTGDQRKLAMIPAFRDFCTQLALATEKVIAEGKKPLVFGGDHSCAVGVWSGISHYYHGECGVIWIDAHLDSHTPETSTSKNIHGMPAAMLLGEGPLDLLTIRHEHPKIKPENISFIGIRSYEDEEKAFVQKHGIRVYEMEEVTQYGFAHCLTEAVNCFQQHHLPFGISLDLDAIDPEYFSATGVPEPGGIALDDLLHGLSTLPLDDLIALDIHEYNPTLDDAQHSGTEIISQIIQHVGK